MQNDQHLWRMPTKSRYSKSSSSSFNSIRTSSKAPISVPGAHPLSISRICMVLLAQAKWKANKRWANLDPQLQALETKVYSLMSIQVSLELGPGKGKRCSRTQISLEIPKSSLTRYTRHHPTTGKALSMCPITNNWTSLKELNQAATTRIIHQRNMSIYLSHKELICQTTTRTWRRNPIKDFNLTPNKVTLEFHSKREPEAARTIRMFPWF